MVAPKSIHPIVDRSQQPAKMIHPNPRPRGDTGTIHVEVFSVIYCSDAFNFVIDGFQFGHNLALAESSWSQSVGTRHNSLPEVTQSILFLVASIVTPGILGGRLQGYLDAQMRNGYRR